MTDAGHEAVKRANSAEALAGKTTNGAPAVMKEAAAAIPPERPDVVPMDDAFIAVIAECRAAAQAIEAQARGALILFIRQQGLAGEWRIAENGRELVRMNG